MGYILPKGWVETELGNYIYLKNGYAYKTTQFQETGIPVLKISNITRDGNIDMPNPQCVDEKYFNQSFLVKKGDILIAMSGATTGKFGIYKSEDLVLQNQRVGNIKLHSEDLGNKSFVYYLIAYLKKEIEERAYGGAQPNISPKLIETIKIPLPPLAEQERIVAKLDALFAQIEVMKKSLAQIPTILKNFKQQVLDKFYSDLNEYVELSSVCDKIQDGAHHSPKITYLENILGTFPYITSKNIRNNYMKLDKLQYVNEEFHNTIYARCKPELGDVLLTKDGANTGNVTLNTLDRPFSLLSSVCLIKTKQKKLSPSFLKYYFQSTVGNRNLIGEMTGTAIKRVVLKKIKSTIIPLPSLSKQYKIVVRIESLFTKADKIGVQYKILSEKIENLPQTILYKAFKGELVAQLPTDGDAKDLLEEIKKLKVK